MATQHITNLRPTQIVRGTITCVVANTFYQLPSIASVGKVVIGTLNGAGFSVGYDNGANQGFGVPGNIENPVSLETVANANEVYVSSGTASTVVYYAAYVYNQLF